MSDELPKCFGDTELYDPKCPECSGGYDANFYEDGSHKRPKCAVYEACGSHCRAKNAQSRLTSKATAHPGRKVTVLQDGKVQKIQEQTAATATTFVQASQLQPTQGAVMVPNQLMPVNYGMPSYLSVLEPKRKKKGKKWKSLTSEVGRSIGKSMGHSIAHFFDSVPWLDDDD